jgi:hypothetical protein
VAIIKTKPVAPALITLGNELVEIALAVETSTTHMQHRWAFACHRPHSQRFFFQSKILSRISAGHPTVREHADPDTLNLEMINVAHFIPL